MVFYAFMRAYVKTVLFFYFRKTLIIGDENIPKNEAVLFVANHQNALLDPLAIAVTNKRKSYFLSRASAFKNPLIKYFLKALHMIPIYRIRDGWKNLNKNTEIFNNCYALLNKKKSIIIFPEGNHHLNRRIRPLSKGFTRIVFGALNKYKNLKIYIVPVGINYDVHLGYPQSISLYYGKSFLANTYYNPLDLHLSTRQLVTKTSGVLKKLTTHIDDLENYDSKIAQLKTLNVDFLNPLSVNKLLKNLQESPSIKEQKTAPSFWYNLIFGMIVLSAWLPYIIWKLIKPKIKDPVFISTFRFGVLLTLVPLFYLLEILLIYNYFGLNSSLFFIVACFSLAFLLKWVPYRA